MKKEITDMRMEGLSFQKIAARYKVSPETVRLFISKHQSKKRKKLQEEQNQEPEK